MELMARYPDNHFDLAIVDIEYGIGASRPSDKPCTVKQKNGTILNVKKPNYTNKDWDFKKSDRKYFEELYRVSKNQIIWGGNYYGLSGGYLIWDKLNGDTDQYDCEMAWVSGTSRTDVVYYLWSGMFQGETPSKNVRKALRQIGDKSKNEGRIHPTQKPVKLYEWLLDNYAKEGHKILDTHAGSFSIGIACHYRGFQLTACELDKEYYDAAVKRFKEVTSQQRFF